MFLENKYSRTYQRLVDAARSRPTPDRSKAGRRAAYFEEHHILPKALGGRDLQENFVYLTAKEHFVAHLLLPKMTEGSDRAKMLSALNKMLLVPKAMKGLRYIPTGRTFEIAKKAAAEAHRGNKEISAKISAARKGQTASLETRAKMAATRLGKKLSLSDEQRKNRSERQQGIQKSQEHCAKLKIAWISRRERIAAGLEPRKPMSKEGRKNISVAKMGMAISEDQKMKNGKSHKKLWNQPEHRQKVLDGQIRFRQNIVKFFAFGFDSKHPSFEGARQCA